jgi:hypothetical protein
MFAIQGLYACRRGGVDGMQMDDDDDDGNHRDKDERGVLELARKLVRSYAATKSGTKKNDVAESLQQQQQQQQQHRRAVMRTLRVILERVKTAGEVAGELCACTDEGIRDEDDALLAQVAARAANTWRARVRVAVRLARGLAEVYVEASQRDAVMQDSASAAAHEAGVGAHNNNQNKNTSSDDVDAGSSSAQDGASGGSLARVCKSLESSLTDVLSGDVVGMGRLWEHVDARSAVQQGMGWLTGYLKVSFSHPVHVFVGICMYVCMHVCVYVCMHESIQMRKVLCSRA